jgi:hypothetical protein
MHPSDNRPDTGSRLDLLPLTCKSVEGGIDEISEWQDWTNRDTTPDQRRIEDALDRQEMHGMHLLHVGIGNSSLAERFRFRVAAIDGITIQLAEVLHARSLEITNYRPLIANKFAPDLPSVLGRQYDYIIDNNPTSFCCCRRHLSTMLSSYDVLLKPGGVIVTDKVGLGWSTTLNDPGWALTLDEFWALGKLYGWTNLAFTDFVVGLRKESDRSRL